ncbi:CLIP domain-containing serine protease HP8-like [Epargyreus clarus]|uniref:CLIP domain-containing serine protease HP8-like n=1 Tax=Epargyreus clarus TaxID=520877 RepID=UPI003C2FF32F
MEYIKYVLFVFVLVNFEAFAHKGCADCISITKCPSAANYLHPHNPDNVRKLREAFCGFNGQGTMVCCSTFPDVTQDAVENHPNINLLPKDCGDINGDRIVGGKLASLYEFPWMALISHRFDDEIAFRCAGSVINSRYILTAAHCIADKDIVGIRIGEFDLRYEYDCLPTYTGGHVCESHIQDIPVESAVYHEKYVGYPRYAYDIGLIRLATPIDFAYKNAQPICLPTTKELRKESIANKIATVAGWGLTENLKESSVLLKVSLPIQPEDECINFYSRILEPSDEKTGSTQFCAGTDKKDTCSGDSGGALLLEETLNNISKYIQYGIVSQGRRNCGVEVPSVYTAVAAFMPWILDHIKQ